MPYSTRDQPHLEHASTFQYSDILISPHPCRLPSSICRAGIPFFFFTLLIKQLDQIRPRVEGRPISRNFPDPAAYVELCEARKDDMSIMHILFLFEVEEPCNLQHMSLVVLCLD